MPESFFTDDNLEQIGDSSEAIKSVMSDFEEAKKFRQKQEQRWRLNEDLRRNKIDMTGSKTITDIRNNLPLTVIESIKPIINDYLPTYDVMPEQQNDVYYADMVQKRASQLNDIGDLRDAIMDAVDDSLGYSDGIIEFKPILEEIGQQQGEDGGLVPLMTLKGFEWNAIDPFVWYPAPYSTGMRLGKDARFHIFAVPMHKDEIKSEFDFDAKGEGKLDDQRAWIKSQDDESGDYSLVITRYKDDIDKDKYPNGRVTIICEGRLISDEPFDFYRLNYFQLSNYRSKHETFGYGEPELIATHNKAINEGLSSIFDSLRETGSPKFKIAKSLWNRLTGNISKTRYIEVNRSDDVTYLQPSAPSPAMFSAIELTLRLVDIITGINDVSAGRNQTSNVTSGRAIMALQEASQSRVRYKISKEIAPLVKDIGRMATWFIQNYDMEIVSIRQELANGEMGFTEFNPTMQMGDARKMALAQGQEFNPETFRPLADSQFDIRVTTGFTQPDGRLSRREEADIDFDAGRIGIETWAEWRNLPDKKAVIEQFYQRQGDMQRKQLQEEIAKELPDLIQAAMENPEEFAGSKEEDVLLQMVMQLPEIMVSDEFMELPIQLRMRLAQAVVAGDGE